MTWQQKMDFLVGSVLGDGYNLVVDSDKSYSVTYEGNLVARTETLHCINSHWMKFAVDAINFVIKVRIEEQINYLKRQK